VSVRTAGRVGKEIVSMATEQDFDHVVMGHHGSGAVERAILGSAAETVLRAEEFPVTVVP
jgi:nucleotide-binding universal stress UspA family protein